MLGGIAFSVYEWLKCALVWHSFLIVEGPIDKMRNIYPFEFRDSLYAFCFRSSCQLASCQLNVHAARWISSTRRPMKKFEYPENGTGPVATFTAIDPEGESIVWSLAVGADMEDFEIDNGVLRFKSSPDFESSWHLSATRQYICSHGSGIRRRDGQQTGLLRRK